MHKLLKNIVAVSALCASVFTASVSYAEFYDMPQDPVAAQAITNAVKNGLLNGMNDDNTEIAPDAPLTRAQMATILVRAMGAVQTADISAFTDVAPSDWFYDSMQKAVAMKAFEGDGNELSPQAQITTEQAYTVLSRIFYLKYSDPKALDGCSDAASVSDWAKEHIIKIYTSGYECNKTQINPQKPMTRAEFAIVMDNLVKTYVNEPGVYGTLPAGNIVIRTNGVTFQNCTTSDDVYVADCVTGDTVFEGGDIERIVARGGNCVINCAVGSAYAELKGASFTLKKPYTIRKQAKDGSEGGVEARGEAYTSIEAESK